MTGTSLHCIINKNRNSWMYFDHGLCTLFFIDPPPPNGDIIRSIEAQHIKHFHCILTTCQKEKKENIAQWLQIYPLSVHIPDVAHLSDNECVYSNGDTRIVQGMNILSDVSNRQHAIVAYKNPYLFSGALFQKHVAFNKEYIANSHWELYQTLPKQTIILASVGPIGLLENLHVEEKTLLDI